MVLAQEVCNGTRSDRHQLRLEGKSAVAPVDRDRMHQVLVNVVDNAIKYSPAGGEVRITVFQEPDYAGFRVADPGIGIAPEEHELIFGRFTRGSSSTSGKFTGLGLGLFLCKCIVEEHGGHIRIDSAPGRGSTFEVVLPTVVPESPSEARRDASVPN